MNRTGEQTGPKFFIVLRANQRATEIRLQVSWCCRISAPAMARLLIVAVIVGVATGFALPAHEELLRYGLYGAAGLAAGARPRNRS